MLQISGHVTDEEGKKRIALVGMWNSYLDMQKCDEEGTPLPGSELVRLWTVSSHVHFTAAHLYQLTLWQPSYFISTTLSSFDKLCLSNFVYQHLVSMMLVPPSIHACTPQYVTSYMQ